MQGQLFTEYFLEEGIRATPEWSASVAARQEFESFREAVRQKYDALKLAADPNEAVTEQELIRPMLLLARLTRRAETHIAGRQLLDEILCDCEGPANQGHKRTADYSIRT